MQEEDLLGSKKHFVVLGPPGAGKTTTLKRIAQLMFTGPPVTELDDFQTPLLIRLREFNLTESAANPLLIVLAKELGLETAKPIGLPKSAAEQAGRTYSNEQLKRLGTPSCEGEPIDVALPKILNELHPVILLDGLDEVSVATRRAVEEDIETLLEGCETYKVIVTCRTGEYVRPIGYMDAVEVCSLTENDIETLAASWLGDRHRDFLAKLGNPSIAELAQRPLFLTHLLAVFDQEGALPEQPYEVYEQVVMLMLREWDRERDIRRKSRYSDFGPKKKLRFLAAIAFELTYELRIKIFSSRDMVRVYEQIHDSFALPTDEAKLVAEELESHTGIVAEAGGGRYEFAHLTIQEYLCAEHLVTSPFPQRSIPRFLSSYPAPLAIATALSADSAGWLAGVVLHEDFLSGVESPASQQSLEIFLTRLESENPIFANGAALGFCVLALCFRAEATKSQQGKARLIRYLDTLTASPIARAAFIRTIRDYYNISIEGKWNKYIVATRQDLRQTLRPTIGSESHFELSLPSQGRLPFDWLHHKFSNELGIS